MLPDRLSTLVQRCAQDPAVFAQSEPAPVLLWNDAPLQPPKPLLMTTVPNYRPEAPPGPHDPLVFHLVKGHSKSNAFGLGITLGRASSNDVPVDQPSVSRFHCYFQKDAPSGVWYLVDAESFNGSYIESARLAPNRPAPLPDRARLTFGSVEMRFLSTQALLAMLQEQMRTSRATR